MTDKPVIIGEDLNRRVMQRALLSLRAARGAPADRQPIDLADVDVAIAALDAILSDPIMEAMVDLRPGEPFFLMRGRDPVAAAAVRWYVRETVWKESGTSLKAALSHEIAEKMDAYRGVAIAPLVPSLPESA